MCGINGVYAFNPSAAPVNLAELERTRDRMLSRGPDGAGIWLDPKRRLGFGHRRLAIIDPAAGVQPMLLDAGRYAITFNGEIYNFAELRLELERYGEQFLTHSDTEVLLHLYRRLGRSMVDRLRGMFAFAIWDAARQELFIARDPHGIKPLYYCSHGGTFRFASQVKALLASGAVDNAVDSGGLVGFLLWGSVPEPLSICANVRSLPAGASMLVRETTGPDTPVRYWTLSGAIHTSIERARGILQGDELATLRQAMNDSVSAHMVSDVPVGAFLSAGLDSSTIVGLARQVSGRSLQTITLTSKAMAGTYLDEAPAAVELAELLRVQHSLFEADTSDFDAALDTFLDAMDQPSVDGLNTWFVSAAAHGAGLKVALSGLGGDELLGGYRTFATVPGRVGDFAWLRNLPGGAAAYRQLHQRIAVPLWRCDPKETARLSFTDDMPGAYAVERGLFRPWQLQAFLEGDVISTGLQQLANLEDEVNSDDFGKLPSIGKVMVLEGTRYMRNQLLRDSDWAGMAHSLEIRVPLVDRFLTELVGGLCATGRIGKNKALLGHVLQPPLPSSVVGRRKTGFTLPLWKWLRQSEQASAWKHNPFLQSKAVNDEGRWAYVITTRLPGAPIKRRKQGNHHCKL